MVGNIGGEKRFDYTAIGDTVNTAARLEGANKFLGTRVCISGATAERCPDLALRPVGELVLKGKSEAVAVFEPLGPERAVARATSAYREAFEKLALNDPYTSETFEKLVEDYPEDGVAAFQHADRIGAEMRRRYLALLAMAMFAAPTPAVWAAEMLVIGAEGVDLAEGDIVDSATPIQLTAGARVTLISRDGTSVTLKGPFDGPPFADAQESPEERTLFRALGTLFAAGGRQQGATKGATRGGGGAAADVDAWLIDTGVQGDACARAGGPVTLWRAASDKASALKLTHTGARASAELEWPPGAATLAWPAAVPLENGAEYLVRLKGVLIARKLTLHLVPGDLPSEAHRAAWMAEHGCLSQARALLAQVR